MGKKGRRKPYDPFYKYVRLIVSYGFSFAVIYLLTHNWLNHQVGDFTIPTLVVGGYALINRNKGVNRRIRRIKKKWLI